MRTIQIGLLLAVSLAAISATAHHAEIGRYDPNDQGTIEGEITDIFWRNPHVRLLLSRTGEDGQDEEWEIEFGSVNTVVRLGVSRDLLAVGDRVAVYGSMGRNGVTAMFANGIVLPDGREVALQAETDQRYNITENAQQEADSADESLRADIFRVWVPVTFRNRLSMEGGSGYPLTEAGRAIQARWDPEEDPALLCIPPGMPTAMANPYPVSFEDRDGSIVMRLEEWDGERIIYVDGDGEPSQPRMGRSVGRWEGNTLFVETRDIDWRYVDDIGTPQSEDVVINERFILSEDGTDLAWEAEVVDPVNFTEPVPMEVRWTWIQGQQVMPFNCELPADRQ